jgi:ribosome-binding protein aMBF1 (putative translation factor)
MRPDVLAQLRRAIERSPLSQAEISRAADLKESVVSRFRRGSELTVINAQRIAKAIGHRLVLERVKVKKTAKKGDR